MALREHWRWIPLCLVAGAAAAYAGREVALRVLPEPQLRHTFFAWELGLLAGLLAAQAVAALRIRAARGALLWTGVALATAVAVGALVTAEEPRAYHRRHFDAWIPLVAGAGIAVHVAAFVVERLRRRAMPLFTALLVGLALAAASFHTGLYAKRVWSGDDIRAWNMYHYYLGSKYFPELGYHQLYAATLAADDAWQRDKRVMVGLERARAYRRPDLAHVERVRDMHSYEVIPRDEAVARLPEGSLSDERLAELRRDLEKLRPWMSGELWAEMMLDLGYNPGPAWVIVGRPVAELLPLEGPGLWAIANSDVPVLLATLLAAWWGFGWRAAATGTLFLSAIHFNETRFTGGFLQYDWLLSTVAAVALYRRGFGGSAGAALSWGAMTRVFPGFLAFPILWRLLGDGVRARRGRARREGREPFPARRDRRRLAFAAAFCAACTLLLVGSHLTGRGLQTWPEWVEKIRIHSQLHPVTSIQRLGVGFLALHEPTKEDVWATESGPRRERLGDSAARRHAWQAAALALLAFGLWRRRDSDAMILMLFFAFTVTVTSRYYGSTWMLLAALGATDRTGRQHPAGALATLGLLAMPLVFHLGLPHEAEYLLVNYVAFATFGLTCLVFGGDTLRDVRRSARRPGSP